MPFHSHTLPNGLTLIGEPSPAARSAAVGFFVRTGSRDERADESGVSHFLEHMMFKGTPRRTALDVNLDFDRIGASYNAFTSEENTVYYAAVLPEYLPKAVDILADILRPSLRTDDFDTEKQVILEEIGMYDDQPGFAASDHARRLFYGPHPLGNSVLGTKESVGALTRDGMHDYFARRYAPTNIVVSAAGHYDWAELVRLVTAACGHWEKGESGRGQGCNHNLHAHAPVSLSPLIGNAPARRPFQATHARSAGCRFRAALRSMHSRSRCRRHCRASG